LETNEYTLTNESIDLTQLAQETIHELVQQLPKANIEYQPNQPIVVLGDRLLLKLVITNLITNAYKYTVPHTAIAVAVKTASTNALLTVSDLGQGIPNTEKLKVFDKFYRLNDEQTRSTKGTGLGLYLCKKIVKDHNGSISVEDNLPAGSIFTVKLNLQK
jgi:two-component system, OmpR family, sensor histidine kinase CiaH